MARCKACGAEILWIKTKNKKAMPCNPQKIFYKKTFPSGELTLITPDGRIAKGILDPSSDIYGYESHFATCPAAEILRRR